jgi:hypothetical protein
MALTTDQASGIADRTISGTLIWLASFVLGKFAAKGYLDASDVPQLSITLIILGSAAWGWWVNRPKAILQAAGNVVGDDGKKTIVIASPELADAIPVENVKSNITTKVVSQ